MNGRAMPVNRVIRVVTGMTTIGSTRPWHRASLQDLSGGRRPGRIGARRRLVGWLADFVIAAVRVHHDPPGFPAVPFLVAARAGQRVADDPGEAERQGRPGQHEHRNIQVTM